MTQPGGLRAREHDIHQGRRHALLRRVWVAVVLGVVVTSCSSGRGTATSTTTKTPAAAPTPEPTFTTEALASKPPTSARVMAAAKRGTALSLLATLAVKGRAPMTGYSRDQFGAAWADTDRNGCDTRNDVLRRDLDHETLKSGTHGCVVLSGDLQPEPYTASDVHFVRGGPYANELDIDHVVALGDAWVTGASYWPPSKRLALANDPVNLLAVDPSSNRQKGDADAASWLPPNKPYRCAYVARQVAVKAKYHLWVTSAEHDAIARVLSRCPTQLAPTGGNPTIAPISGSGSTSTSSPRPVATRTGTTATVYANCDAMHVDYPHGVGRPGAVDHTSGTPVTNFYVSEALYDANTARDRDKDGIACEKH